MKVLILLACLCYVKAFPGDLGTGSGGLPVPSCACQDEINKLKQDIGDLRTALTVTNLRLQSLEVKTEKGVTPTTGPNPCADGWVWSEDIKSCYKFQPGDFTWSQAQAHCQEMGASMVRIESQQEQDFLSKQMRTKVDLAGVDYWIGLTDDIKEGEFRWNETGELTKYTAWDYRSPANKGDDGCVEMRRKSDWMWNDNECDDDAGALCEIVEIPN